MPIIIHSRPLSQNWHFLHFGGAIMAEERRFPARGRTAAICSGPAGRVSKTDSLPAPGAPGPPRYGRSLRGAATAPPGVMGAVGLGLVPLASTSSPVALGEASEGIAGPAIRPGLAPPAAIEIRAPRQRVVHLGSGVCVVAYSIAQHSKLLAERRHYSHCACLALASACAQGKRRQHGRPQGVVRDASSNFFPGNGVYCECLGNVLRDNSWLIYSK
jgi:hypothetical protein